MKIGASKIGMKNYCRFFLLLLAATLLLSCDEERSDETVNFIPGKPLCLQESLALADSLVIYNAQGLAYSTNKLKEIKRFAKAATLDEEYPEIDRVLKNSLLEDANLSISLYRKGKLVDYLLYYEKLHPNSVMGEGRLFSLQGVGRWKKLDLIQAYFKERKISTDGKTAEFKTRPGQPALKVDVYVDTFELKEGKSLSDTLRPREFETGLIQSVKKPCAWRLENAFKRHYKDGFNLSVDATLTFGDSGRVVRVDMNTEHPEYGDFLKEVKSILYYAWMPPEVRTQLMLKLPCFIFTDYLPPELRSRRLFSKVPAQDIVKSENVHLSFSRSFFKEGCNQDDGKKDSIEITGYSGVVKEQCDEVTYTKDLATGGINYLQCGKLKNRSFKMMSVEDLFDRYHAMYVKEDLSLQQVVNLKLPPCFAEEP
jgi:hypothetical protein